MRVITTYVWRDLPQENRYWYVGGVYGGKKGVLEWCESQKDAIERARLMCAGTASKYDIKIVRLT